MKGMAMIEREADKPLFRLALLILMLTLAISGTGYAQAPQIVNVCQAGMGVVITPWFIISILFILITFGIYLLVYFASMWLNMPVIGVTAKSEFIQVAATLIILIFIAGVITFMCTLKPVSFYPSYTRTCGGADCTVITGSQEYIKDLVTYNVNGITVVTVASAGINNLANFKLGFKLWGIGIDDIKPFDFLNSLDFITSVSQTALISLILLTNAYYAVMIYTQTAMLGYLLPLGILMRCFQPTRGFGGAVIGVTFALLFIMPLTFVINDMAVGEQLNFILGDNLVSTFTWYLEDMKNTFTGLFMNPIDMAKDIFGVTTAGGTPEDVAQEIKAHFWNHMNGGLNLVILQTMGLPIMVYIWMMKIISAALVANFILPAINFAIITGSARALSRLFGEQIDITNLTRMI